MQSQALEYWCRIQPLTLHCISAAFRPHIFSTRPALCGAAGQRLRHDFPPTSGRSDAKAPRRIESLCAVSCYNGIITKYREIVNKNPHFRGNFINFFADFSLGDSISVWGRFFLSILLVVLVRPLVIISLLAAPLGKVERHQAAAPAGKADQEHHQWNDGNTAVRLCGGILFLRLLHLF